MTAKDKHALTRNQQLVLDRLTESVVPLGAYALLEQLRGAGFRAPLQVYRALDRLVAEGLVHRIESLNAFVACNHAETHADDTVVFVLCDQCGSVAEFAEAGVSRQLDALCRERGFCVRSRTVEVHGECGACVERALQDA